MVKSSSISDEKKAEKSASYICKECKNEFYGVECPQCGNKKDNLKLAPDGIDQQSHRPGVIFGTAAGLRPADELTDSNFNDMMNKQAQIQAEELNNNLRETYVLRSEIKKKELELERMRKEREYQDAKAALDSGRAIPPSGSAPGLNATSQHHVPAGDMGAFSPFTASMSPQAVFMTQLMKMDKEKRAEFLNQLSEADPQSLMTLSSMMGAAQMPMGMGGGNQMMNPMMGNGFAMPPWMMYQMMQQQQQNQQHSDPMDTAIGLVSAIFELSQKAQPKHDDSYKEILKEYKEELKHLRQKVDERPQSQSGVDLKPLLDKLGELQSTVASTNARRSVVDSIKEVKELVTGLESVGLVTKPGAPGKSVEDEIKLKRLEHEIHTDQRKLDIEQERINAEKTRSAMGQAVLSSLFQRSLHKKEKENEPPAQTANANTTVRKTAPTPVKIIDEFKTDGGIIRETKPTLKSSLTL